MSHNTPQTLSVKRKRNEVPVDHLSTIEPFSLFGRKLTLIVIERNLEERKRLKGDGSSASLKRKLDPRECIWSLLSCISANPHLVERDGKRVKEHDEGTFIWRRIAIPHAASQHATSNLPPPTPNRRFHVSRAAGNVVLFEDRGAEDKIQPHTDQDRIEPSTPESLLDSAESKATSRKRPGANAGRLPPKLEAHKPKAATHSPSDDMISQFEKFSYDVENEEVEKTRLARLSSPSKFKPKAPKLRYKDRHPEQAAALEGHDPDAMDAMDVDGDDYVYDTYVREIIMPDASGKIPEPRGIVGFIVLTEEEEEWWFGEDESDREFDTDDQDSNAEDYYANDYPEDETDSDDDSDRGGNDYIHGADNEDEYDLIDGAQSDDDGEKSFRQSIHEVGGGRWGPADAGSDEEEDKPVRQTVPKVSGVYWGQAGEKD
jgi:hypothetical protein